MRPLRTIALAEATSFLALLVATAVKYSDGGEIGVKVLGPIHGALFVLYVLAAVNLRPRAGWPTQTFALVLLGAVVPLGGFVVDRWLASQPEPAAG